MATRKKKAPVANKKKPRAKLNDPRENPMREITVSEKHLERDLVKILLDEVKVWDTPWTKLHEGDQRLVIDRIKFHTHMAVMLAVAKLAAGDTHGVRGKLAKVTIADKVVCSIIVGHDELARLAEHAGKDVVIALTEFDAWSAGIEQIQAQADQRDWLAHGKPVHKPDDGSGEEEPAKSKNGEPGTDETEVPTIPEGVSDDEVRTRCIDNGVPWDAEDPGGSYARLLSRLTGESAILDGQVPAQVEGDKHGSADPSLTSDGQPAMTRADVDAMPTPADSWKDGHDGGQAATRVQSATPEPGSWEDLPSSSPDESQLSDSEQ